MKEGRSVFGSDRPLSKATARTKTQAVESGRHPCYPEVIVDSFAPGCNPCTTRYSHLMTQTPDTAQPLSNDARKEALRIRVSQLADVLVHDCSPHAERCHCFGQGDVAAYEAAKAQYKAAR